MTHDDIIIFLNKIFKLEGPIYGSVLIPEENTKWPVILNLGDQHIFENFCPGGCLTKAGCYSLISNSFLDAVSQFAAKNNIIVDFFIETWGLTKNIALSHKSAMVNMIRNIKILKAKYDKTIHFHFADTRDIYDENRKADMIISSFLQHLLDNYEQDFKTTILEWFTEQLKYYERFNLKQMLESMICILKIQSLEDYFNIPLIQHYSRTYHEFSKAPEKIKNLLKFELTDVYFENCAKEPFEPIRQELIKLLNDCLTSFICVEQKDYLVLFDNDLNLLKNYAVLDDEPLNYDSAMLNDIKNTFLLDVYSICRIFKKERKFVITYFGNVHTKNIEEYLDKKKFFYIKNVWQEISPKCLKIFPSPSA